MAFVQADAAEVLFGGAAGGGKSYAQAVDALIYACRYPGSRQLILRRTLTELDRSLIPATQAIYPQAVCKFKSSARCWEFSNRSIIEFGHCQIESDVIRYQSAEYDVIRFDELTHFTKRQYTYLFSRLRGANGYPKQIKATTNPGGVGHDWVKRRFIDVLTPDEPREFSTGSRVFLPAKVTDNHFLTARDPLYLKRLQNLDERERRALLEGDWELTEGRYFPEFTRETHVVQPFAVPPHWRRFLSIDYGLDMLAALWIAVAPDGCAVVYREVYESGLVLSAAAERILQAESEEEGGNIVRLAPPDLWNRRQESGRAAVDVLADAGLYFQKSDSNRVAGWYALREMLRLRLDAFGEQKPQLTVFSTCRNLIRTLSAVQRDTVNPNDVAGTPHELTHAPDALRYFARSGWENAEQVEDGEYTEDIERFLDYG